MAFENDSLAFKNGRRTDRQVPLLRVAAVATPQLDSQVSVP